MRVFVQIDDSRGIFAKFRQGDAFGVPALFKLYDLINNSITVLVKSKSVLSLNLISLSIICLK